MHKVIRRFLWQLFILVENYVGKNSFDVQHAIAFVSKESELAQGEL